MELKDLTKSELAMFNMNVKMLLDPAFGYTQEKAEQWAFDKTLKNRKMSKRMSKEFKY